MKNWKFFATAVCGFLGFVAVVLSGMLHSTCLYWGGELTIALALIYAWFKLDVGLMYGPPNETSSSSLSRVMTNTGCRCSEVPTLELTGKFYFDHNNNVVLLEETIGMDMGSSSLRKPRFQGGRWSWLRRP